VLLSNSSYAVSTTETCVRWALNPEGKSRMSSNRAKRTRLLLLGAGASFGHGLADCPRPPQVSQFFCSELIAAAGSSYRPLFRYLKRRLGKSVQDLAAENIERLFEQIEPAARMGIDEQRPEDWVTQHGPEFVAVSPMAMLKSYVVDAVWTSTSWLRTKNCPFHESLIRQWVAPGDTVVSFNYDLIADKACLARGDWDESTGYGWLNVDLYESFVQSQVTLLKPHGSLNWYPRLLLPGMARQTKSEDKDRSILGARRVQGLLEQPDQQAALAPELAPKSVAHWNPIVKRAIRESDSLMLAMVFGQRDLERWLPVIMPPSPYKPLTELGTGELRTTWRLLRRAFSEVCEVLVIGFKFMDPHFNAVMSQALGEGKDVRITVVSPDADAICERLAPGLPSRLILVPRVETLASFMGSFQRNWVSPNKGV